MVAPEVFPVMIPEALPIEAIAGKLLLQLPVPESVTDIAEPIHTADGPEMAGGSGLATSVALPVIVRLQPVPALLASTVYTPPAVCIPKSSAKLVPGSVANVTPPSCNE